MTREEIEADLLDWMASEPTREDDRRFERLALALFRWQAAHCAPYGMLCKNRSLEPASVVGWQAIPAVPTGAFKETPLRGFPPEATIKTFRTSGTSSDRRGELHLDTLALYEASLFPSFTRGVLSGIDGDCTLLILAPAALEAPDSSLSHMFEVMVRRRGTQDSGFHLRGGKLDTTGLEAAVDSAEGPVVVCGTAFAFVHWMEELRANGRALSLPSGTRIMETGGFKGRARERTRDELYAEIAETLGVRSSQIVNQYGMTELGSQFYDSTFALPGAPRHKMRPPWVRVRLIDPVTGDDTPSGEPGMIQILDLANTGSVAAILTADLGRTVSTGFEVLGRDAAAEERGCSIAIDEMLGAGY